ncbi:MAG: VCBS repeat-containing protein [Flavobacteriales bacterium]|nr:VCBS repeat-containing protein [Flavobacteriales bacterium]
MRPHLLLAAIVLSTTLSAQNSCSTALPIGPGIHLVPAITGTPATLVCTEDAVMASASTWYAYTAVQDTNVRIVTQVQGQPDQDTRVSVATGACGALGCLTGDDDSGPNLTSAFSFRAEQGTTYRIIIENKNGNQGCAFELSEFANPSAPVDMVSFSGFGLNDPQPILGVVDLNDDGLDDLVVPGEFAITVHHQQADGSFVPQVTPHALIANPASQGLAVGDIDNNGRPDLFYAGAQNSFHVLMADANGTSYAPNAISLGGATFRNNLVDVDVDGHLDGFVTSDLALNLLLHNDGAGNLAFTNHTYGTICGNKASIWTDVDNDGRVDAYFTKSGCSEEDVLMHNDGNLVLTAVNDPVVGQDHDSRSSAWGDFDNDGDMDAFVGASGSPNWSFRHLLLRNDGNGGFTNVILGSGLDVFHATGTEWVTHDLNNDGRLDILGGGRVHYGIGNMQFVRGGVVFPEAIGDLNNDGSLDLANLNLVMLNSGTANHGLRVRTVGTVSNRSGIGARVEVHTAQGLQIRDIRSGEGARFMSSLYAHFGLGPSPVIDQVVVRWPSGIVDVVPMPAADTLLTVVEGTMPMGLNEAERTTLQLYPNPAADRLHLADPAPWAGAELRILDALGREVLRTTAARNGVDVSGLRPGTYWLRLSRGTEVRAWPFVKV